MQYQQLNRIQDVPDDKTRITSTTRLSELVRRPDNKQELNSEKIQN